MIAASPGARLRVVASASWRPPRPRRAAAALLTAVNAATIMRGSLPE